MLSVLRLLSATGPVLVAVDDAQWLDSPSARILTFAVRRLDLEAVGVMVTARTPILSSLRFDLAADPSRHQTIALGAMSVAALHELIKQHSNRSVARPALVEMARICGGNPFYALEMAAVLPEGHSIASRLQVPPSLTELVVARLGKLPTAARRALLMAAALSQPTTDLIDATALGAAQRAGIVSIDHRRIQFAHPLLASALYGQTGAEERRSLHRRLAEVVTEPEERARHAALSAIEPDTTIARELEQAAMLARSRGAPSAAADLLDLAVALTPPAESDARAARLVAGAGFRFDAGDLVGAQANLEKALAGPLEGGPRTRALHLMGQIYARRNSFTQAAAVAAQALEAAAGDAGLIAEIELDLAYYVISLGDLAGAAAHARGAVAAAERACGPWRARRCARRGDHDGVCCRWRLPRGSHVESPGVGGPHSHPGVADDARVHSRVASVVHGSSGVGIFGAQPAALGDGRTGRREPHPLLVLLSGLGLYLAWGSRGRPQAC